LNTNYSAFLNFWENEFKCQISGDFPLCPKELDLRSEKINCKCRGTEKLGEEVADHCVHLSTHAQNGLVDAFCRISVI
jgi:hypothetical protein